MKFPPLEIIKNGNLKSIIGTAMEELGNNAGTSCKRRPKRNGRSRKINKHEIGNYGHYLEKITNRKI